MSLPQGEGSGIGSARGATPFDSASPSVEAFIHYWQDREGGQERANFQPFLGQLCRLLNVPEPDPADASPEHNNYTFERRVTRQGDDGDARGHIDLYKRECFVLEAKQSRLKGGKKEIVGQHDLFGNRSDLAARGRRGAGQPWDIFMLNAKKQAEDYARALPPSHGWPPFILVCDVGHCIEVFADFSGQGKNYSQFPDRQGFRIYLEDLRKADVRDRLRAIWVQPQSLNPSHVRAKVTRDIAERLATVSKVLEAKRYAATDVALFLMRCLFTMFAEDMKLLPDRAFRGLLNECKADSSKFAPLVTDLWHSMNAGTFAPSIRTKVLEFNGNLFANAKVLPLDVEEIGELAAAAEKTWREVDPAIFGTLLEQALDPAERRRLGAHYTPRPHVERLVIATVIEPLREDWRNVLAAAETKRGLGDLKGAAAEIKGFHNKLCETRVLDPACGTGNFLYVAMALMKELEGEVIEAFGALTDQTRFAGYELRTIDPHQFLGLELNPRAAAIAELVLWIGYLQWHFRIRGGIPPEPILREFKNIQQRNAVLTWAGYPAPQVVDGEEAYPRARRPAWPEAEFIVGNPPFLGKGAIIREALGDPYVRALWRAHPEMNESADFVLYWWDRAADILSRANTALRRFGFVTTNSVTQVFNRKVLQRHLNERKTISLVMAIPDYPWTKASPEAAAVRIAMTVCQAGAAKGVLHEVTHEESLDTDHPVIALRSTAGEINADLSVGVDVTTAVALKANTGLASMGPALGGRGFVLTSSQARHLNSTEESAWLKKLTTGKDITGRHRGRFVIDVRDYEKETELRRELPHVYQHLRTTVYPKRRSNNDPKLRSFWWRFRRSNDVYFSAIKDLPRFIATVETTKHRTFVFVDADELIEHGVVGFGFSDAWVLGILSSRIHVCWTLANGGTLEDRPRYNKDVCFDTFPFPEISERQRIEIGAIAEELDSHRKRVLHQNPRLTLTALYNVLDRIQSGLEPSSLTSAERVVFDEGLVLVLKTLHDALDVAVAEAYGWDFQQTDAEIVARIAALNRARAQEEAQGRIRWLRPEYQFERYGAQAESLEASDLRLRLLTPIPSGRVKPAYPDGIVEQTAAVFAVLAASPKPLNARAIATQFKQGKRIENDVASVLAALSRLGHLAHRDQSFVLNLTQVA